MRHPSRFKRSSLRARLHPRCGLRASEFLMRDPAKGRLWMIVAALAFLVVATYIVDRLMN